VGSNFNYLELAFNAAVDPYFDFFAVVTVAPGEAKVVDVEEAFVDTRQLPFGFQLRIGKFLSALDDSTECTSTTGTFTTNPCLRSLHRAEGFKKPRIAGVLDGAGRFSVAVQLRGLARRLR